MCFFFKQKTAYEMRISDWSSDVCSSDLRIGLLCSKWWRILRDPDLGRRELHRACHRALTADEAEHGAPVSVQRGQHGLLLEVGTLSALERQMTRQRQIFKIIVFLPSDGQRGADAGDRPKIGNGASCLEQQRIGPLTKAENENFFSGRRTLQHRREQDQRMRRARTAEGAREIRT